MSLRPESELWRITERAQDSASTRPVYGHGLLFYPTGFAKGQLLAVDPGAKGEAADTTSSGGSSAVSPTSRRSR